MLSRIPRTVLSALLLTCLLALASCLPAPLGDPEKSEVDPKLAGFWNAPGENGSGELYILAAFDKHCYAMQYVKYTKTESGYDTRSSAWRAWLTDLKGARFITIQDVAHMADAKCPGDATYPAAKIDVMGNALTVTSLDPSYPKFKDVKDSAVLTKIVEENVGDPKLYGDGRPMTLNRLIATNEADAALMKLASP